MATENEPFEALVQRIQPHARLVRSWPLEGGVSAQVTALEVEYLDGTTVKWVVRQHGPRDLQRNPNIAADEFRLLQVLQSAGVAAPAPVYFDAGAVFPAPVVVVQFVEGASDFAPTDLDEYLRPFAVQLARIHHVNREAFDLTFLPQPGKGFGERPALLDDTLNEGRIRDVLETLTPPIQENEPTLLHGDYWPGNLLWKNGQLVAVIDWEDAGMGDPLADVANARLELLWAFGAEAMERFTHLYQALNPISFAHLPYWDLCAALRPASKLSTWGLDAGIEKAMRQRHQEFVAQAFEKLQEQKR